MTASPNAQEPLRLTLEEGLMLLEEQGNGRDITYEARTPDGKPCWVAWEYLVTLGPADTWEEALSIALDQPVVARDEAAELKAAVREYLDAEEALTQREREYQEVSRTQRGEEFSSLSALNRATARAILAKTNLRRLVGTEE